MIDQAAIAQLRTLYQKLRDEPIERTDPRYVQLFEDPQLSSVDPVARLSRCIQFAARDSSQLFSGHRGTGKSTQLLRLKHELEQVADYKVVVCDMEKYLPMTDEVEVVDFLLGAAGALSEALIAPALLGADAAGGYWTRFVDWLNDTQIEVSDLGLADIKLNLKEDATFRTRIRERMKLHVGAFRAEVHAFVESCVKALRKRHGSDTQLIIIYDSIEHLRGTTQNADAVASSIEQLFRGHGEALRFPDVHTIYTVPPWLRLQFPGVATGVFDTYCHIPCIKVRERPTAPDDAVVPNTVGLDALWTVANKRGDMQWLLGDRAAFDELALASGGHLRDLFKLLSLLVLDAANHSVPASAERRQLVINDLREAYLGFTNEDAKWLQLIEDSGTLDVATTTDHKTIALFLDTHVLLAYRNGTDWYSVHPLIRADVARRAKKART